MSNKPQQLASHGKVLTTNTGRLVARFMLIFATIGLVVGIGVMVFLNLGLPEKLSGLLGAGDEMVVSAAANETGAPNYNPQLKEIDVTERNIAFVEKLTTYDGSEQSILIEDGADLTGLTVTYVNNKHTDAGEYTAVAIISGEGYKTLTLTANFRIFKASFSASDFAFNSKLVEYDSETVHSVEVTLADGTALHEGVSVEYLNNDKTDAGKYNVTAVVYDKNHNPLTLEATLTIVDLEGLVGFDGVDEERGAIVRTYNNGEHKIELNTSKVLKEIVDNRSFTVTYDNNVYTNAGEYTITATVSAEGFTTFTKTVKLIIEKGNIDKVYGFKVDVTPVEYDEEEKSVVINHYESFPEDMKNTVEVKYYNASGELVANVVNPGTYTVKVSVDGTDNCNEYSFEGEFVVNKRDVSGLFDFDDDSDRFRTVKDSESGEVKRLVMVVNTNRFYSSMTAQPLVITYTYGEETLAVSYTFAEEGVTVSYMNGEELVEAIYLYEEGFNGEIEFEIPFDFVNVGEYTVQAHVAENDYDAETNIHATYTIKYATLADVSLSSTQMVFANGNFQLPTKYEVAGKGDVEVEYLYNGEETEGFKYFGVYNLKLRFTQGNYQTTKSVRFIVMFNPVIALIGMLVGILLGVIAGLIASVVNASREKLSQSRFLAPSSAVANARGGIICESFAKAEKNGCSGRLYLSEKALEFYSDDFELMKNNFLINLDDIRNVDVLSPSQIEVYASREAYVFTVPDGRAAEWAHHIIKA